MVFPSFLIGAGAVCVYGALTGSAWLTGGAGVAALALLAWRTTGPRATKLLLWAGLAALAGLITVEVSAWRSPGMLPPSGALELIHEARSLDGQWRAFRREVAEAVLLTAACLLFLAALARRPWRTTARDAAVGTLVLCGLAVTATVAMLLDGSDTSSGSAVINWLVAIPATLAAWGWAAKRLIRRGSTAPLAFTGVTTLALLAAAQIVLASHAVPEPPAWGMMESFAVSVSVGTGLDGTTGKLALALLGGAALVVIFGVHRPSDGDRNG